MCGSSLHGNRETRQAPTSMVKDGREVSMKERTRSIDAEANRVTVSVGISEVGDVVQYQQ